ncbi:hypothetical protein [Micromonospora sp. NPDC047074]|uniref:hypothetical protein n=1 Tax=Micromonospora sp. NPDC047074 TaxID=3154339 RepID=UPI003401644D
MPGLDRPPRRQRPLMWAAILFTSLVAATLQAGPASAHGSHSGWEQRHLADMHTWTAYHGIEDEEFCVNIIGGATHSYALSRIKSALFNTGTPSWHLMTKSDGSTDVRIDIRPMDNACSSYGERRSQIDYEYWVRPNNSVVPACGSDNVSCVTFDVQTRAASGSHVHYEWGYVHMDADHLGSDTLINHETGHIFGLMDGGPNVSYHGGCPSSLMHLAYYGCSGNAGLTKPTDNDISSVRTVAAR